MQHKVKKEFNARSNVYSGVTEKIVAELAKGERPWYQPWRATQQVMRPLRANGEPYRGINVLMLWLESQAKGYQAPTWMTFNKAAQLGGHVRKGEHGCQVVKGDTFQKTEKDDQGKDVTRGISYLKFFTVFNAEQIDGLEEHFYAKPAPKGEPAQLVEQAEAFFRATGANVHHGGDRAFYAPGPDQITLPAPETFWDKESYEATKAHEIIHWTGHTSRLDRQFDRKRFGDEGYAMEELVAELGSAFLCADLGITPEPRPDHAAYLGSWLKLFNRDTRALFTASADSVKACDFLHQLQP